jgi:hypothetical protein
MRLGEREMSDIMEEPTHEHEWDVRAIPTGGFFYSHGPAVCAGNHCTLHNPSNHHMIHWPTWWRKNINLMNRMCEHGILHPDPDDLAHKHRSRGAAWASRCARHNCDGCCTPPTSEPMSLWRRFKNIIGLDE